MVRAGGNGGETGVAVLLRHGGLPKIHAGAHNVPPAGHAPGRGHATAVVHPDGDIGEGGVHHPAGTVDCSSVASFQPQQCTVPSA